MKQNSTVKEQSLHPQPSVRSTPQSAPAENLDERVLAALHATGEKKAIERQVQAIADEVYETLKKSGHAAARMEGYKTAEWILLDYGDFVVHVFEQKARQFYDLERLWRESKRVELPAEFTGGSGSSLRRES